MHVLVLLGPWTLTINSLTESSNTLESLYRDKWFLNCIFIPEISKSNCGMNFLLFGWLGYPHKKIRRIENKCQLRWFLLLVSSFASNLVQQIVVLLNCNRTICFLGSFLFWFAFAILLFPSLKPETFRRAVFPAMSPSLLLFFNIYRLTHQLVFFRRRGLRGDIFEKHS